MAQNSKIEWTDDTDNPIIVKGGGWYCFKVSPGCENCYAEKLNQNSFFGGNKMEYTNRKQYPEMELRREMLAGWARKKKPKKRFVSSVTDVFGEFVPDEFIFEILDAMIAAPLQTFQVLTKRATRMREKVAEYCAMRNLERLPENIWMLVSIEDQKRLDERLPDLIKALVTIRGLSIEPLLGPLDFSPPQWRGTITNQHDWLQELDWIIVGGESGLFARPMQLDWVLAIRNACLNRTDMGRPWPLPFFFKQWGEWIPNNQIEEAIEMFFSIASNIPGAEMSTDPVRIGKVNAGRLLDGVEYSQFPNVL